MSGEGTLPVVDLRSAAAASAIEDALVHRGFLYVTGHGIDAALSARAFRVAAEFFAWPAAAKQRFAYAGVDANFGYQGLEVESLDPQARPDLKESFTMRNALAVAPDSLRWPKGDFRDAALALYRESVAVAQRLLAVLATNLGATADFFASRHTGENITLRFLHYPANLSRGCLSQLGAGAHTDYGSITLLFQDDVGGLELREADGEWRSAAAVPGAAVINTGDLMERWTNGRYRSTLHRVKPISGDRDRYSIALFVDPDAAVQVDCFASCTGVDRPARYPSITAGEHIRRKIAATHETAT